MKKRLMLILFALLSGWSAMAYDFEVDGIYYNFYRDAQNEIINNGEVQVTWRHYSSGNDYSGSVVIPATVTYKGETYRVTEIGEGAFYVCGGLTSMVIPEGVTSIGSRAFFACSNLTSVTIPNSVTSIGRGAFQNCTGLSSVTIPNSVASIESSAFSFCTGLTSITIPESVDSIGEYAFDGCSGLTSVEWNAKHCCDFKLYYTCNSPFNQRTSLTSITFGDKVEHIPAFLFYGCSGLTSITIPEGVTSIGSDAFRGASLTSVEWNARHCSDISSTSALFYGIPITIGKNVERIPANFCSGGKIYVGDIAQWCGLEFGCKRDDGKDYGWCGYKYVNGSGWSANSWELYVNNEKVVDLAIPEGVPFIGEWTFWNCDGPMSLTLPESIDSIGYAAFYDCGHLTSVEWNAKHGRDYDDYTYNPYDYKCLFGASLKSITFGNKVEHIPANLLRGCCDLTSVTLPKSVTSIGNGAFVSCGHFSVYYAGDIAQWCAIDFSWAWNATLEYGRSEWDLYIK